MRSAAHARSLRLQLLLPLCAALVVCSPALRVAARSSRGPSRKLPNTAFSPGMVLQREPRSSRVFGEAAAARSVASPPAKTPLLWLSLGDSITWGCGSDSPPHGSDACPADAGGYRVPLALTLEQAGYNVSTMGTLRAGPSYVPPRWLRHEGHAGCGDPNHQAHGRGAGRGVISNVQLTQRRKTQQQQQQILKPGPCICF